LCGLPEFACRHEQGIDVLGSLAGMKSMKMLRRRKGGGDAVQSVGISAANRAKVAASDSIAM